METRIYLPNQASKETRLEGIEQRYSSYKELYDEPRNRLVPNQGLKGGERGGLQGHHQPVHAGSESGTWVTREAERETSLCLD